MRKVFFLSALLYFSGSVACAQLNCTNWLKAPSYLSSVSVGDLDVSGNQLTVEATFSSSSVFNPSLQLGKIVSKHTGPSDVNYSLMAYTAEITTTNGYVNTPPACFPVNDKVYHVAMVYNGAVLKFYRNGFLLSSIPWSGNLVTNDLLTTIACGPNSPGAAYQQLGYINEVRIWNVARTQAQLQTYMSGSLPSPTTQAGLLGYYTFDNLVNKQGNAAYNGTINGGASINQPNPNCSFVADSCAVPCTNWLYTPSYASTATIGDLDIAGNQLTVEVNYNSKALSSNGSWGHLVSKHTNTTDINYAISPNGAEITTTGSGYVVAAQACPIQLNKTYHTAMVYDGTSLKFYRNGFLMSQTPCTGNLINNDLIATIAQVAGPSAPGEQFNGYINEVRIWNVARTQTQLQTFMNSSLPGPTTQAGLQGYYTFDNLLNKQGNAAYNATLSGAAISNQTNTNCNFVADSCAASCTNWLNAPSQGAAVTVGDLDVTGNQLTIEANFNRTVPLNNGIYYGHLVSKHSGAPDVNYALLPNGCELTTSTGYHSTFQTCVPSINKTYHVAMVYNGALLKFYRNGFLMSQVPCTGNMAVNDLQTTIAQYAGGGLPFDNQFIGYVNEVRIWNVARTQAQLQTFMNSSLPGPTTQPGLLGYYTFDNLVNKQGNAAYNGTLLGAAAINQTNTSCGFVADSCLVNTPISNIINDYTPVLAFNPCDNKLTVEDGTKYNAGDTVLLIQMKGAVIDSSNTAAFGNIADYKSAGNYEFNYVKSRVGNIVELKNKLTRSYEIPAGKVQLIRVPYYQSVTIVNTLTCLPWDGSKGGVLVLNVKDTLTLNADIDVSRKGFRGGKMRNSNFNGFTCNVTNFFYADNTRFAAGKGEGIAQISSAKSSGKGPLANGGGGGMDTNSGGGGGSNAASGGRGGNELNICPNYLTSQNWGYPGTALSYSNANNKIFMGGGGGAGHCNNQYEDPPANADFNGGNGGGIVIIAADILKPGGKKITAKGDSAYELNNTGFISHDGMGGGGAAGTILLSINNYLTPTTIDNAGGRGGNMLASPAGGLVGPGGGGSGGVTWLKQGALPANFSVFHPGGTGGVIIQNGNDSYGTMPGQNGQTLFNLALPVATVPFKPNIDSVRIKDSLTSCKAFDFKGSGFTNTSAVAQWQWFFGDGGTANTQNTAHTYPSGNTTYTVKLVVTDVNGCKDSVTKNVITGLSAADAGRDTSFCSNTAVAVMLQAAGGNGYSWTPAGVLSNSAIANPVATVSVTTKFYVTVTNPTGCTGVDSVTVFVRPLPLVKTGNDTALCKSSTLVLTATGASSYVWHPGASLSDSTIGNPVFTAAQTQQLIVTGTAAATGCKANDTINITVNPLPAVKTIADTAICNGLPITLTTTGAVSYQWSPAVFLSNPNIASPVFNGSINQTYQVTGTDANGCKAKDTIAIAFVSLDDLVPPPDKAMCRLQTVTLRGNNGPGYQYTWSPPANLSNAFVEEPVCNTPVSTLYLLTIKETVCNLQRSYPVVVTVNPLPVITVSKTNDIDCAVPFSNLVATGAQNYVWSPATGLSNAFVPNPVATSTTNTLYTVTGTDANGCINSGSVQVNVSATGKDFTEIPNSFTPNGDGLNDCFGPGRLWRNIVSQEFMVYNRWGERVFYSTSPNACWDGFFKGVKAKEGAYVYYLKAKTLCGTVEKKGNVILIR
jgi:gliding motility-associated-like protein